VVADEHDFVAAESGEAAEEGLVIAELAVAVELAELAADHVDVVFEEGTLGVAGHLHGLPGTEVVVGFAEEGGAVGAQLAKLLGVIDLFGGLEGLKVPDLGFELGEGLFELQDVPGAYL